MLLKPIPTPDVSAFSENGGRGYEGGRTVKDVVAWADEIIQNTPDAPYEIIDISSSVDCSNADMVSKLSSVPG